MLEDDGGGDELRDVALGLLTEHPEAHLVGLRYFNVFGPGEEHKKQMASMIHVHLLCSGRSSSTRIIRSCWAIGRTSRESRRL